METDQGTSFDVAPSVSWFLRKTKGGAFWYFINFLTVLLHGISGKYICWNHVNYSFWSSYFSNLLIDWIVAGLIGLSFVGQLLQKEVSGESCRLFDGEI